MLLKMAGGEPAFSVVAESQLGMITWISNWLPSERPASNE